MRRRQFDIDGVLFGLAMVVIVAGAAIATWLLVRHG